MIRNYLLSVVAAAMIAGIVTGITKNCGSIASIIKMLAGLFLTLTILHPIIDIPFDHFQLYVDQLSFDAENAVNEGKTKTEDEMKEFITERTGAYILEKATTLGADVSVEVILDGLVPYSVRISGAVSPYAKQQISNYITANLGIQTEDQQWVG